MDQCTHEVRMQYWKNIISQCQARPAGQTAKQWIEDMVEKIVEFYRTAEDGKLPGKYDQELFDEVKKYSTSTSKAIKEIVAAQKE